MTETSSNLSGIAHPSRRRARIVMIAYACSPDRGSENFVGWNRAVQAGRFADTWVICEGRECEAEIEQYIAAHGPVPGVRFVVVPLSDFQSRLQQLPGCYYRAYRLWHRAAFAVARQLHAKHSFDLAHQVNMVGYREPGYLWQLGIPFVWGPIGGTQNFPVRFLPILRPLDAAKELLRNVVNSLQLRFSRRVRLAARAASKVLAANSTNQVDLAHSCGVDVVRMLETGVSNIVREPSTTRGKRDAFRILWSGMLEPRKALRLLLDALAKLPANLKWQLRVVGDGPLRAASMRRAEALGINDRIEWLGWLPLADAIKQYDWADVFAFTSLRDTSGNVVLEAMSRGVPVVCADHQGMADIVTPESGIKIPVHSPKQLISDFSEALRRLSRDELLCSQLGEGARQRAEHYLWSKQGDRMATVYRDVLDLTGNDLIHLEPSRGVNPALVVARGTNHMQLETII